jgi:hypothetical protein
MPGIVGDSKLFFSALLAFAKLNFHIMGCGLDDDHLSDIQSLLE